MNKFTAAFLFLAICNVAFCHADGTDEPEPENYAAPNIVSRAQWGANPLKTPAANLAQNPPPYVVIHHSDTAGCNSLATCKTRVKSFQNTHVNVNKWDDIGYNFLVGEDGNVYEGRGWGKHGAHSPPMNRRSIGICVIGNFNSRQPNAKAVAAVKNLIAYGVSTGKIKSNYKLVGHRQTVATSCPGNALYNLIKTWPRWSASV